MNMMGFDARRARQPQLRPGARRTSGTRSIPLANFPYHLGERRRRRTGKTPARVVSRRSRSTFDGVKVGFVGFTNEDAPDARLPGRVRPVPRATRLPAVKAEANAARKQAQRRHRRHRPRRARPPARSPTRPVRSSTSPTQLTGVDVVIGDHTELPGAHDAAERRAVVTENLSKGVRFTRVRLVRRHAAPRRSSTRPPTSTSRGTSASRPTRRSRRGSTS